VGVCRFQSLLSSIIFDYTDPGLSREHFKFAASEGLGVGLGG